MARLNRSQHIWLLRRSGVLLYSNCIKHMAPLQAEIAWESCKEESSGRRYQRFLEQELGQVLQAQADELEGSSQPSERQPNRHLGFANGQALTGTFQPSERQLHRQPRSFEGQGQGPAQSSSQGTNGVQLIRAERQTVLRNRQLLPFHGQSRPYQDSSDRYSHASNKYAGVSNYQQQQSIGYRHGAATTALSSKSALPIQADPPEQTPYSVQGLTNIQSRAQRDAKPANSQRSVSHKLSQPHEEHSALALMCQAPREHRWQSDSRVNSEDVLMGITPLAGDEGGPQQHASAPSGDGRGLNQQQPKRHVLSYMSHMRGISPQRRQLLLQARVALFESDSSSDEEDCSVQEVS